MAFTFPDLNGHNVSLDDERFTGKPVIIQIMGSWCPNCADETSFLAGLHKRYRNDGLEIVALAYENTDNFNKAVERVKKHRLHFGAEYDFLIAGNADKKKASKTLPMLNHIISYPTTIFIDRTGRVRRIYTGFYGPGTGKKYHDFVADVHSLVGVLLSE